MDDKKNQIDTKIPCKEIIFENKEKGIEIYYDEDYKIRIASKSEPTKEILKAKEIVTEINNLPMSKKMRKSYGIEIANIYQFAYSSSIEETSIFGKLLLNKIEQYIVTYKKIEFIIPSIICTFFCIVIGILAKHFLKLSYMDAFIYGPIGGILSIIINQKDINIDYKVDRYVLTIEAVKMIVVSVLVAIVGIIAIKSKFIFSNIDFEDNHYSVYLLLIVCGYSQSFIPNLLNKLATDNSK